MGRRAVHADPAVAEDETELRSEHDVFAPPCDSAPDELLVVAGAVGVGGVDERDPEVERRPDRLERLGVVARTVDAGEAHRPEPERRDEWAFAAEPSAFHAGSFRSVLH